MAILSALITLTTGIMLICMLQTAFRESHIFFRLSIALIAGALLCMSLGPLWGAQYTSFPQMLLNVALLHFVSLLRARQLGWKIPVVTELRRPGRRVRT